MISVTNHARFSLTRNSRRFGSDKKIELGITFSDNNLGSIITENDINRLKPATNKSIKLSKVDHSLKKLARLTIGLMSIDQVLKLDQPQRECIAFWFKDLWKDDYLELKIEKPLISDKSIYDDRLEQAWDEAENKEKRDLYQRILGGISIQST